MFIGVYRQLRVFLIELSLVEREENTGFFFSFSYSLLFLKFSFERFVMPICTVPKKRERKRGGGAGKGRKGDRE